MANINIENSILILKTIQINAFKTLLSALKEILIDTNIIFQESGMKIINMDKSHTLLISMCLEADKFQEYVCSQNKIIIGVNIGQLYKLINSADVQDTLTIYIDKRDYNEGNVSYLSINLENGIIRQSKTQKLKLIETEIQELQCPCITYSAIITLPSNDFQKIIRDLSSISEKLEIKSVGNELIFKSEGSFAKSEIVREETENNMVYTSKHNANKIITGVFSLKNLQYFIKCSGLCPVIELYLDNEKPLCIKYNVASLGYIKFSLSSLPCEY